MNYTPDVATPDVATQTGEIDICTSRIVLRNTRRVSRAIDDIHHARFGALSAIVDFLHGESDSHSAFPVRFRLT